MTTKLKFELSHTSPIACVFDNSFVSNTVILKISVPNDKILC